MLSRAKWTHVVKPLTDEELAAKWETEAAHERYSMGRVEALKACASELRARAKP
jgi:hypothetical protein